MPTPEELRDAAAREVAESLLAGKVTLASMQAAVYARYAAKIVQETSETSKEVTHGTSTQ